MVAAVLLILLAASPALAQHPPPLSQSDQWFYAQRAYPSGTIPEDALGKAMLQRRVLEGKFRPLGDPSVFEASSTWGLLGPSSIVTAEGAVSGRVTAIATDSRNPEAVYIGAAGGGVWRSTDGGVTWQSLGDNLLSLVSGSLALDERTGVLYYGTGDHGAGTYGAGVLRSHDGGTTWISSNGWDSERNKPQFTVGTTPRILLHPSDPRIILAARNSGLWRSSDGGESWFRLVSGVATDVAMDPSNPNRMYLALGRNSGGVENAVYRSNDGGNNWGRVPGLPFGAEIGRISLAVAPGNGSVVYAVLARSSDQQLHGVYKSSDGGNSWVRLAAPASLFDSNGRGHGFFDNFVAVDPRDANVVYLGGVDLWKTTDGGESWRPLSLSGNLRIIHEDQFSIAFKPGNPDTVYIGNDGGIYRTTDGGVTWNSMNTRLPITQFNSVAVHPQNPLQVLGGTQDQGLIRSNGGSTWEQALRGDAGVVAYHPADTNIVLAARQRIRPMRSLNGGGSFSNITGNLDPNDRVAFYPPLASSPPNPAVIHFGTYRVWNSSDGGESWRPVSSDLTNGGVLTALAVAADAASTVYVGSSDGRVYVSSGPGFWRSGSGIPDRWVTAIVPDPRDPAVAYLSVSGFGSGHVFKTTDGAITWTDISGNLPDAPANALAVDPRGPVYVATDVGVFRTEDGASWTSFNIGLPNVFVTSLALEARSGTLTAGTYGRSAYQISLKPPQTGPNLLARGVVHAATSQPLLAPGAIVTLYGTRLAAASVASSGRPLPTTLGGTTVTVNGQPVPLFFVSPGQINFQLPFEVSGSQVSVLITTAEGSAATLVQVLPTAPGLFEGTVAHGATGAPVDASRPAVPGEVLVVFATGLGVTNPAVASGAAAPANPPAAAVLGVTASVGGRAAPVFFAGLAPGFTGLYQVNFQVPEGVSGNVPLTISSGGRLSNSVIVSVR